MIVPQFLKSQGAQAILAPLQTMAGEGWGNLGDYKLILYPYIEGQDGYQVALSDRQWLEFGAALRDIHTTQVPPEVARLLLQETYSPEGRDSVRCFLDQVEHNSFDESVAAKLAAFMVAKRAEIEHLIARADELGRALQFRPLEFVLCHSDIHPGNLHICPDGRLFIVDWDAPILAPKERDLVAKWYNGDGCHGNRQ